MGDLNHRVEPRATVVASGAGTTVFRLLGTGQAAVVRLPTPTAQDLIGRLAPGPDSTPAAGADDAREDADDLAAATVVELGRLRALLATLDRGERPEAAASSVLLLHVCRYLLADLTGRLAGGLATRNRARADELAANGDEPLRLHLGCGSHRLAGWTNIDLADPAADLRVDVRNGLPFDDGIAESVYIAHLLEHVEYPREAETVLRECRRVLRDGGLLRIVVPDLHSFCTAYVQRLRRLLRAFRAPVAATAGQHTARIVPALCGGGRVPLGRRPPSVRLRRGDAGHAAAPGGLHQRAAQSAGQSLIGDDQLDYSWANRETAEGLPYSLIMEAEAATR
ncbi:hypothetical protein GCM10020218_080700 [Dactylosporangium vinaceum]